MLVGSFFKNINPKYKSHFFSGLSFNSLNVKKNNIFFSIKGTKINGNQFIKNAIKNGAKTIVSNLNSQGLKNKVLYIKTNNLRNNKRNTAQNNSKLEALKPTKINTMGSNISCIPPL